MSKVPSRSDRLEIMRRLSAAGIEAAVFEAGQIAREFPEPDAARAALERRIAGEPLQYIIGEWEFFGIPFKVGSGVLIPRADTEVLVEQALSLIGGRKARVLDLCSGSGAIAVAIALNSSATVTAVEKSPEAFRYLTENVRQNGAPVECIAADIFEDICPEEQQAGAPLSGKFDLILSNPPYIASGVIATLSAELGYEPKEALDGGEDGLIFYRRLADYWSRRLVDGGVLAVEIGYDQQEAVTEAFRAAGLANIKTVRDYSSNPRVVSGIKI